MRLPPGSHAIDEHLQGRCGGLCDARTCTSRGDFAAHDERQSQAARAPVTEDECFRMAVSAQANGPSELEGRRSTPPRDQECIGDVLQRHHIDVRIARGDQRRESRVELVVLTVLTRMRVACRQPPERCPPCDSNSVPPSVAISMFQHGSPACRKSNSASTVALPSYTQTAVLRRSAPHGCSAPSVTRSPRACSPGGCASESTGN